MVYRVLSCFILIGLLQTSIAGQFSSVLAQAPLYLANDSTTIDKISFVFRGSRTFDDETLRQEIVLRERNFRDRMNEVLPFRKSNPRFLNPIELQRDVVRLRNFYQLNGFLAPEIEYSSSRLDTSENDIHIIFQLREGPPMIIQDFGFYGQQGGYLANELQGKTRSDWINFRDRIALRAGDRYNRN